MHTKLISIVTGANSGLGKEFVKLLLNEQEVTEIWAIARNEETLKQLSDEYGSKLRTFSMDLSDRGSISDIGRELAQSNVTVKYPVSYTHLDVYKRQTSGCPHAVPMNGSPSSARLQSWYRCS